MPSRGSVIPTADADEHMAAQQLIVLDDTELKASSQMVCGITDIRGSRTRVGTSVSVTSLIVHLRNRNAHRCGWDVSKRLLSCHPEGLASRYPLFKPPVFFQKFGNIEISARCCMDPLAVCLIEPIQFPAFDICGLHRKSARAISGKFRRDIGIGFEKQPLLHEYRLKPLQFMRDCIRDRATDGIFCGRIVDSPRLIDIVFDAAIKHRCASRIEMLDHEKCSRQSPISRHHIPTIQIDMCFHIKHGRHGT